MTQAEKDRILEMAMAADEAGDNEAVERLLLQIPIAPGLAIGLLDAVGPKYTDVLLSSGINFSDVAAMLGPDWYADEKKTERRALDKSLMDAKIAAYERERRPHL